MSFAKRQSEASAFVSNKCRKLEETGQQLEQASLKYMKIKRRLDELEDTYERMECDAIHLELLKFMTECNYDTIYLLPKYVMKELELEDDAFCGTSIFEVYKKKCLCSKDLRQKILDFRNDFKCGIVRLNLFLIGNKALTTVRAVKPNTFTPAMLDGDADLSFYVDDNQVELKEATNVKRITTGAYWSGTYRIKLIWIKRISQ